MGNFLSGTIRRLAILYRVLAMLLTATLIVVIFPHTRQGMHYDYKAGAIWRSEDLTAPFDFAVMKSEDEIQREQDAERQRAILYYRASDSARGEAMRRLMNGNWDVDNMELLRMRRQMDSIYRIGYLAVPQGMGDIQQHTIILLDGNVGSEHKAEEYVTRDMLPPSLLRDSILVPSLVLDENRTALPLN